MTDKHRPGRALQQVAHLGRDQVGAQDEDRALRAFSRRFRPRRIGPQQRLESDLKILRVRRGPFIQDHEIDGQKLHPPILVGEEQLPDNLNDRWFRRRGPR